MSVAAAYLDLPPSHSEGEPGLVTAQRQQALDHFRTKLFPKRNNEAWRLTDLKPLEGTFFPPASELADPNAVAQAGRIVEQERLADSLCLVFVNGLYISHLSSPERPDGVMIAQLKNKPTAAEPLLALIENGFSALAAAHFLDGPVVRIEGEVERPIQIIHISLNDEPTSVHSLTRIDLAAEASATVLETHIGRGSYWSNQGSLIVVGANANLTHGKIIAEDDSAHHLARQAVRIAANAKYDGYVLVSGGSLVRQDTMADLQGEKGFAGYNGLILRKTAQATIATEITHDALACETREVVKSVVEGDGHAVFQGKITVTPEGQKTNAYQLSQAMLLTDTARADAKPELEIFADDVKCSHGSTVGDLDDEQLFYLISRGIPKDEARAILIRAFAEAALDPIEHEGLKAYMAARLDVWLGAAS
ncbi:Fe-S cluster assembly protein SufD [Lacibacterium aquatile]|uniref:Fe-S cluster assembly protein SufD n=1 Tax=Lacibacterium aquatile TaxID=1168082 RepID=A0ABW5DUR1_9PROT